MNAPALDPDVCLRQMLETGADIVYGVDLVNESETLEDELEILRTQQKRAVQLSKLIRDLDSWILAGGWLSTTWSAKR